MPPALKLTALMKAEAVTVNPGPRVSPETSKCDHLIAFAMEEVSALDVSIDIALPPATP
jgi:hypothetical protein